MYVVHVTEAVVIQMVCNMSPHGLVTGGVDTSLLLWKVLDSV